LPIVEQSLSCRIILLVYGQADVSALPSSRRAGLRAGRYKIFSNMPAYRQAGMPEER